MFAINPVYFIIFNLIHSNQKLFWVFFFAVYSNYKKKLFHQCISAKKRIFLVCANFFIPKLPVWYINCKSSKKKSHLKEKWEEKPEKEVSCCRRRKQEREKKALSYRDITSKTKKMVLSKMYCSEQIVIPDKISNLLKTYAKGKWVQFFSLSFPLYGHLFTLKIVIKLQKAFPFIWKSAIN